MICCFMHFDFSHILRTEKYKEKVIINNGPANLFEKVHNFVATFYLKTLQQLRPLFCQKLQFMQSSQCLKTLMIDKFFSELIWQNTILFTEQCFMQFWGIPWLQLDGQCEHLAPIFLCGTSFSVHFQSFKLMGLFMNWIFIQILKFVQEQNISTMKIYRSLGHQRNIYCIIWGY